MRVHKRAYSLQRYKKYSKWPNLRGKTQKKSKKLRVCRIFFVPLQRFSADCADKVKI